MTLKKQAISGVKWTTVSTIFLAVTQLLKISVLARFLDKADFGLIAIVVFVLGFTNLFIDMGLTSAILHKQNITKNEYVSYLKQQDIKISMDSKGRALDNIYIERLPYHKATIY
ncbi:MAG: oligosaccharide flippase family protein [Bacteroidales bacterium]|nr:oligosaccharide flippase family protein [Bacteroidales bacterium]